MANTSISKLGTTDIIGDEDFLLISQKENQINNFVSKKILAKHFKSRSAYDIWIENQTSEITYLNEHTIQQIIQQSNMTTQNFYQTVNLTTAYQTYLTQQINNTNLSKEYFIRVTNTYDYYTESGLTENQIITLLNLSDEYQNFMLFEDQYFIQYLKENDLWEDFISEYAISYQNLREFIFDVEGLEREYSNWRNSTDSSLYKINYFLQRFNLDDIYQSWLTENPGQSIDQFFTALNLSNIYNTWVTDESQEIRDGISFDDYLSLIETQELYNAWLLTHDGNISEFFDALNLQQKFNTWVTNKLASLTEAEFLEWLKGADGKDGISTIAPIYENFWISANCPEIPGKEQDVFPEPEGLRLNSPESNELLQSAVAVLDIPETTIIKPFDNHVGNLILDETVIYTYPYTCVIEVWVLMADSPPEHATDLFISDKGKTYFLDHPFIEFLRTEKDEFILPEKSLVVFKVNEDQDLPLGLSFTLLARKYSNDVRNSTAYIDGMFGYWHVFIGQEPLINKYGIIRKIWIIGDITHKGLKFTPIKNSERPDVFGEGFTVENLTDKAQTIMLVPVEGLQKGRLEENAEMSPNVTMTSSGMIQIVLSPKGD